MNLLEAAEAVFDAYEYWNSTNKNNMGTAMAALRDAIKAEKAKPNLGPLVKVQKRPELRFPDEYQVEAQAGEVKP